MVFPMRGAPVSCKNSAMLCFIWATASMYASSAMRPICTRQNEVGDESQFDLTSTVSLGYWRSSSMKTRILALVIAILIAVPATSHAFGIMRWTFDAIANQLGLDRGPIPKVVPNNPPSDVPSRHGINLPNDPNAKRIYIQAEGF